VLEQPFCDGSLGLVGLSDLGASCLGIATSLPDNVKAAVWVAPVLGGNSVFTVNGALRLHHNLPWMGLSNPRFREIDWGSLYKYLPLKDALDSVGIASPLWHAVCTDLKRTWAENDLTGAFKAIDVPGLHFAGFWDFMLDAGLFSFLSHAKPGRKPQALFAGPWSHNGIASEVTQTEHRDYGPQASSRFRERMSDWFDHHLKGRELSEDLKHGAAAYVPGVGWVRSTVWPPTQARPRDLFLGAGTLEEEPGAGGSLSYTYDPADPVPTEGGALWEFPRAGLNPGPALVTTGNRKDVLVFQSRELAGPVTALGPAQVELHVETDAPSTDFTAKLVDVEPGGAARVVADSIYRLSEVREGMVTIDLQAVGHVFEAGHRIRLDVSSSNFPKFDRNLNTGVSGLVSSETKRARQTIRCGASAPSRLRLSVL
jgi:putative CocE/NonD family hydrolase